MEQSQTRRDAIVEAMIRVAGSKGYLATSVADVLTEASVSRTTFYKHFDDKHECFLAAHDLAIERLLAATMAACEGRRGWGKRARAGLTGAVELLADDAPLGRTAIVEATVAGTAARERQMIAIGCFAQLLEVEPPPVRSALPANTALMAVGAVAGLILDGLQAEPAVDLSRLLPELEFALLVPFIGPRAAAEAYGAPASSASA